MPRSPSTPSRSRKPAAPRRSFVTIAARRYSFARVVGRRHGWCGRSDRSRGQHRRLRVRRSRAHRHARRPCARRARLRNLLHHRPFVDSVHHRIQRVVGDRYRHRHSSGHAHHRRHRLRHAGWRDAGKTSPVPLKWPAAASGTSSGAVSPATNAKGITLRGMQFVDVPSANGASAQICGSPVASGEHLQCAAAIHLQRAESIVLHGLRIENSAQLAIHGDAIHDLTLTDLQVLGSGDELNEHGIQLRNVTGALTMTGCRVEEARPGRCTCWPTPANWRSKSATPPSAAPNLPTAARGFSSTSAATRGCASSRRKRRLPTTLQRHPARGLGKGKRPVRRSLLHVPEERRRRAAGHVRRFERRLCRRRQHPSAEAPPPPSASIPPPQGDTRPHREERHRRGRQERFGRVVRWRMQRHQRDLDRPRRLERSDRGEHDPAGRRRRHSVAPAAMERWPHGSTATSSASLPAPTRCTPSPSWPA